jgi:hypothetical protein
MPPPRRLLVPFLCATALIAAALYLRDPPWLAGIESGFRGWETTADGMRYRWTSGHASFFVSADASGVVIPARTTFAPGEPPVHLSITIDDRPADRDLLTDEDWHTRTVRLPASGTRHLHRVDIRVDRVRAGNRGAQIGEIRVLR